MVQSSPAALMFSAARKASRSAIDISDDGAFAMDSEVAHQASAALAGGAETSEPRAAS